MTGTLNGWYSADVTRIENNFLCKFVNNDISDGDDDDDDDDDDVDDDDDDADP